jgi:hypothetical protein
MSLRAVSNTGEPNIVQKINGGSLPKVSIKMWEFSQSILGGPIFEMPKLSKVQLPFPNFSYHFCF